MRVLLQCLFLIILTLELLDTHKANSKYYNPHTFDPQQLEYQNDIRLASRDELPDHISNEDMAEALHSNIFMTELTWPSIFFGAWAAMEPDVRRIN